MPRVSVHSSVLILRAPHEKRLNPVPKPTRLSRLAFPSPSVEAAALQSLAVDRVPLSAREGSTNIKQPTQLLHEASPFKVSRGSRESK
ncbi:hypothetical protein CPAR01_02739 [Colletotrichum paranaense]|uniref:Uncharacterized protein n=4 Tax=Colletotrichum acutatum species complex TaxID=2707335 RepID=A0AAI9Z4H0_9PEZI|nr:uncharacterized protein CCOS01_04706 [Colletotrichum costaricense]XP_060354354.1 uncharacterized protein CPAR01_02739 [Colletotrichum paranaense]KAK1452206.1 hypothetical protein CMEL01_06780 [Colletotrichum melonis]KAK1476097.1 hypothetical protein CCUS01_05201 [Colletotrichum cuscutae]KAK1532723.1 hypothetical protein CCOS01_04706 [Colletotrichum costaricense]KAK1545237.1 hypothetical protein CPAR01_02739 [Colletotrichum paranaense]